MSNLGWLTTLRKFSMSVALPIISFLHFGQSCRLRLDLISDLKFLFRHRVGTRFAHLQVSQMRCPLPHWKILVGGPISSKQTCNGNVKKGTKYVFSRTNRALRCSRMVRLPLPGNHPLLLLLLLHQHRQLGFVPIEQEGQALRVLAFLIFH